MSSEPASKAAERLAVIVDAAERAALSVIDDAEQEAKRYLEEAQARADRMVAERLREVADLLESNGLDSAAPRLRALADEAVAEPERAPAAEEPEPAAEEEPEEVDEVEAPEEQDEVEEPEGVEETGSTPPQPGQGRGSAAARLLATQMAVSGSSREEIEERLRTGFEIDDANEIVDAILGPEG